MARIWLVMVVLVLSAAVAGAQEAEVAPSPYFDCPYINYFDKDCPQLRQLWEEQERRRLKQQTGGGAASRQGEAGRSLGEVEEGEKGSEELDAQKRYLLFPKDSLAPDTPELFQLLLAEPTLANARRYVRWYAERTVRLQAVQALIQLAGRELEKEMQVGGSE